MFGRKTPQQIWDEQQELNRDAFETHKHTVRRANQLSRLGISEWYIAGAGTRSRETSHAEARDLQWMLDRAERCPNNPHNGAQYKPPTWCGGMEIREDRRGPGWRYVEDQREIEARESAIDPLTKPNVDAIHEQLERQ